MMTAHLRSVIYGHLILPCNSVYSCYFSVFKPSKALLQWLADVHTKFQPYAVYPVAMTDIQCFTQRKFIALWALIRFLANVVHKSLLSVPNCKVVNILFCII